MKYIYSTIVFLILCNSLLQAQQVVSVSGIVTDNEKLVAIPFVTVYVKGTGSGTSSSVNGFFSIVIKDTDTLVFSAVGYKPGQLVVPDSITRSRMSVVIGLSRDTVMLDETIVYPWPSPRKFKEEFLALDLEKPKLQQGYMPPGIINKLDTIIPVEPNPIMNPASFIYEKVVLEMIKRLPKRKKASQLPKFE